MGVLALDYSEYVFLAEDDVLDAFELDLVTGVLAEEDAVAIFEEEIAGGVRLPAKPANSRFRFIG